MALILGDLYTGAHVKLTAPRAEDRESLARWSHDAEFQRLLFMNFVRPQPPDFFQMPKEEDNLKYIVFHLRTVAEEKFIGFANLWGFNWSSQSCMLAIGIGEPDFRGRGYGTESLDLLVSYAFRELNMHRVGLVVFAFNERALHVYERYGFVHEGRIREGNYRDGSYFDVIQMGILRPEWERRPKNG